MANEPVLFHSSRQDVRKRDILEALQVVGIKNGDVIFVHGDITSFGKLVLRDREKLLGTIVHALQDSVGPNGTIIMPTFSYSFDRKETFNPRSTRSTVGVLSDFFWKQDGVVRTWHPSHSAAIWGKHKDLFAQIGKHTFDDDSIFGKAFRKNAKLVFFGTPLSTSCTFIHFIEQRKNVPYRYHRTYITKLQGKTKDNDPVTEQEISFFYKYSYFFTDMDALEQNARNKGTLHEAALGDGLLQAVGTKELFTLGAKELDNNIFFLLKNNSFFKLFNYMMLPIIRYMPWLAKLIDVILKRILR